MKKNHWMDPRPRKGSSARGFLRPLSFFRLAPSLGRRRKREKWSLNGRGHLIRCAFFTLSLPLSCLFFFSRLLLFSTSFSLSSFIAREIDRQTHKEREREPDRARQNPSAPLSARELKRKRKRKNFADDGKRRGHHRCCSCSQLARLLRRGHRHARSADGR